MSLSVASFLSMGHGSNGVHGDHDSIKNDAVIVMLGVILLLTLTFEYIYDLALETLEHKHLYHMKQIVTTVFQELTVLGFISFNLFMFTRQGFVMDLNDKLFGRGEVQKVAMKELSEEEEPIEAAPTELKEIFEDVHIFIFVVMATFISIVLGLLILALRATSKWRRYEATGADELQQLVDKGEASNEHLQYWAIRYKFVNPENSFIPSPRSDHFGFSEYLSERLSELLTEMVEIPLVCWLSLFLFALMMKPVMDFDPLLLILFIMLSSIGLLFATSTLYHDTQNQLKKLQPAPEIVKRHLKDLVTPGYKGNVLPTPLDQVEMVTRNTKTCEAVQRVEMINCQEALFLFGAKGAKYEKYVMQLLLFFHTLSITCILKISCSTHFKHQVLEPYGAWAVVIPFVIVLSSLMGLWPLLLPAYTIVTSIGFFADRHALSRSSELLQRRRLARKVQILTMLYHAADVLFTSKGRSQYESELSRAKRVYDQLPQRSQKSLQDLFHAFADLSDVPRITYQSIGTLIKIYNIDERIADCDAIVQNWIVKLDSDKSNDLTFPEFTTLMTHLLKDCIVEDPGEKQAREKQRLEELTHALDRDNDGFITKEELQQQLTRLRPPVSELEIRSLMAEIEGGRFGEMVRPENLIAWITEIEEKSSLLRNLQSGGHH